MSTQAVYPRPNVMVGLTHTTEGRAIIREAKALKVGIGHARGKACDVYVNGDGQWVVRSAVEGADKKLQFSMVATVATRKEAEAAFTEAWKKAPVCGYPRKTSYFNFTRPVMTNDGTEIYVPDFEAIEAHSFPKDKPGAPTEIDIIFLDNEPFQGGYQNWAASELKCSGDGVNALRVLSMAKTLEEVSLAKAAQARGERHFPVVGGCWTCDCPYSKETTSNGRTQPSLCKPSATIKFQLVRSPRVPGTAFFHTGSFRSIPQIFSSLARIRAMTGGRLAGIPLKMVVRSHKTNHNGQAAIQQNVSIEFRPEDMDNVRKTLLGQAWKFENAGLAPRMLDASDDEAGFAQPTDPETFDADEGDGDVAATGGAAAATATATAELAAHLTATAPAPPVAVPAGLPWTDRNSLNAAIRAQRDRIGEKVCSKIISGHGVLLASLRPEDPRALAIYNEMLAIPSSSVGQPPASNGPDERDLF